MVEKILNNTTPYGKIRASDEGSLHSSTLICVQNVSIETILIIIVHKNLKCNLRLGI